MPRDSTLLARSASRAYAQMELALDTGHDPQHVAAGALAAYAQVLIDKPSSPDWAEELAGLQALVSAALNSARDERIPPAEAEGLQKLARELASSPDHRATLLPSGLLLYEDVAIHPWMLAVARREMGVSHPFLLLSWAAGIADQPIEKSVVEMQS
jgi:hypothetical protein